ncbi:DUF5615 family PIN-like protein [Pirellulales bacterium]|nr:DUF5615 family PIN-like protein [Pirellulales bacterium]
MASFKLDENLPVEATSLLSKAGHDALSVLDQSLGGRADDDIAEIRRSNAKNCTELSAWRTTKCGRLAYFSKDPIAADVNPYRFAGNDPVNFADPTGLVQAVNPVDALFGGFSSGQVDSTIDH